MIRVMAPNYLTCVKTRTGRKTQPGPCQLILESAFGQPGTGASAWACFWRRCRPRVDQHHQAQAQAVVAAVRDESIAGCSNGLVPTPAAAA
jgi:hypothetical protein